MSGHAKVPFPTHLLLECIVLSEYNALIDANKEKIKIILSCGTIDTTTGNPILEIIRTIFPEGTATRTNLEALLAYVPPGP